MGSSDTFFTNSSGSGSSSTDFIRDAFKDISVPANSNSGLTDTALTNPLGAFFGNNDSPRFGAKTLLIKDVVLIADRSKWISGKPTYQVLFNEQFPEIYAYVFGTITINQKNDQIVPDLLGQYQISFQAIGDGMGVTGVVSRCAWLVGDDISATATAQLVTDGVNTTTVDFSGLATDSNATSATRYSLFAHEAANSTKDIHDRRITALQPNTLKVYGLVVYFENAGANIDLVPGTTYVDKTKSATTVGATLPLPSYGSSLGGAASIYKMASGTYAVSSTSAPTVTSNAIGSSGTNLLTVTTGFGASFLAGNGLVVSQGTSMYVGSVVSVSTDTLTVSPTLPFGISNVVYTSWSAGPSLPISSSSFKLNTQIIAQNYLNASLGPNPLLDPLGKFSVFQSNLGITNMGLGVSALGTNPAFFFKGASGYLQIDGQFSAAEIEFAGVGILNATFSINGTPGYSINVGQTGSVRRTVFTGAGSGWNSFLVQPGTSMGASIGIHRINLYEWTSQGQTFGVLGTFNTRQAFTDRLSINATQMALGTSRRLYADQLFVNGGWVRANDSTAAGGVKYSGASTNSVVSVQYYGKNFAMVGTAGSSAIMTIDGISTSIAFNTTKFVASEGFHTVKYTHQGGTSVINAFDFSTSQAEMINTQNIGISGLLSFGSTTLGFQSSEVEVYGTGSANYGASAPNIRRFATMMVNIGRGIRYVDDVNLGGAFNIDEDGVYAISYTDNFTTADVVGISKNTAQFSTNITAPISQDTILAVAETRTTGATATASTTVSLRKGDIVRAHTNNGLPSTSITLFRIVQVRRFS